MLHDHYNCFIANAENRKAHKRQNSAFTLVELMITVAIMAILSTIAYASYRSYIVRANRTEAKMALLQIQTAEEKFYLQNNRYVTAAGDMPNKPTDSPPGLGIDTTTASGNYQLNVVPNPDNQSYQATATAQGAQATDDATCKTFTIDNTGTKFPAESTGCWK